jgi:hypothetical protein
LQLPLAPHQSLQEVERDAAAGLAQRDQVDGDRQGAADPGQRAELARCAKNGQIVKSSTPTTSRKTR